MLCAISSAFVRAGERRARAFLFENPALLAVAGALVIFLPSAAVFAGTRAGGALGEPAVRHAAAVAIGAAGAMAGLTLGLAAPALPGVGVPLAVAPVRASHFAFAAIVAPMLLAVLVALVLAALFAIPAAGPRGALAVTGGAASLTLGAAAGASLRSPFRRRAALPVLASACAAWALAGRIGGVVAAGPAAAVAAPGAARATLLALVCAIAAVALWSCAVPRRSYAQQGIRHGRARRSRALPRGVLRALGLAIALVLTRRGALRAPAAAAVVVPVAATWAAALALAVRGEAGAAFAIGLALAAAIVFPGAAHGIVEDARWLLRAAPQSAPALRRAAAAAGVGVAVAVVAAAAAAVAPVAAADVTTYVELEAATALVLGCAAAAGAAVPWRATALQQAASYGAAAVVAIVAWALAARVLDVAAALGVDATVYGVVAGHAVLVAGLVAAGRGER